MKEPTAEDVRKMHYETNLPVSYCYKKLTRDWEKDLKKENEELRRLIKEIWGMIECIMMGNGIPAVWGDDVEKRMKELVGIDIQKEKEMLYLGEENYG